MRKKNYTLSINLGIAPSPPPAQLDVGFMTSRAQNVGFLIPLCQVCPLPAAVLYLLQTCYDPRQIVVALGSGIVS